MAASRERSTFALDPSSLADGMLPDVVSTHDPVDDAALRSLTVEAVAAELEQRQPSDAVSQLAGAVSETEHLVIAYARLTKTLPRGLGWRARAMADHLRSGLERYFPREDRA